MSDSEILIKVDNVSKKFCRDFKRSLWYGVKDTAADLFRLNGKFRSPLAARPLVTTSGECGSLLL